jgi:hypothetical protein
MKKIFLLSSFLLTQTLFATTLTIYDSNVALIAESKSFTFNKTEDEILYGEIPKSIVTNSLQVTPPKGVTILQQKYQKANLTLHNIAKHFINHDVFYKNSKYKLIALSGSHAFLKSKSGLIQSYNLSEIAFDSLPKNLHNSYALLFITQENSKIKGDIKLHYLINNITFESDYVVTLKQNSADLTAWVTIKNNSGKNFNNADVTLIAGELSRVKKRNPYPVMYKSVAMTSDAPMSAPLAKHKSISGYHSYTLPKKIDITTDAINRVALLKLHNIPFEFNYKVHASNPLYLMGQRTVQIEQEVNFKKIKKALPKGIVRIYKEEKNENKILLGEQTITNNPKGKELQLSIGKNFDTQLKQTLLSRNDTKELLDATINYTLVNNSNKRKNIEILIPFTRKDGAKIICNKKYRFTKGNLATFSVEVAPNSSESFEARFISKRR